MIASLMKELRLANRRLWRQPGATLAILICLGLGIGVNSSVFSVVNTLLVRPLPFADPERLIVVYDQISDSSGEVQQYPASPQNVDAWMAEKKIFAGVAAASPWYSVLTEGETSLRLRSAKVTADFFRVLGADPLIGRAFRVEEDLPRQPANVVVLSHELWRSRWNADPELLGKVISINREPYTVIGIMRSDFRFPLAQDDSNGLWLFTPLGLDPQQTPNRYWHYLTTFARLQPDVTIDAARQHLQTVARRLEEQYPDTNTGWRTEVVPLREDLAGNLRPTLYLLLAAVAFVLLIACANVASILLAQALRREHEFSVRLAMGGSRGDLVRQLLLESLLLAALGGGCGLLLAKFSLPLIVAAVPSELFLYEAISIDGNVLVFTLLISLATGIIFGLVPAWRATSNEPATTLYQGGLRTTHGRGHQRFLSALVIAEMAIVLVLLVGAGLTLKSLGQLRSADTGMDLEGVLTVATEFSSGVYPETHQRVAFLEQAIERVKALPGVLGAAATTALPLRDSEFQLQFSIEGRPPAEPGEVLATYHRLISPDYFSVLGIPLLAGRPFNVGDDGEATPVAIISETLAKRFWPDSNPLGQRVKRGEIGDETPWMTIVGIVADVSDQGPDQAAAPTWYLPYTQHAFPRFVIAVRTADDPAARIGEVRSAIREIDSSQPLFTFRTLDAMFASTLARPRFHSQLLGLFAFLGLILVVAGVYGLMAYLVQQRNHEIGVRMALGASAREVLSLLARTSTSLALIGIAVGLLGSLTLHKIMRRFLFAVEPNDPATLVGGSVLLLVLALVATLLPALRAARIDPASTLNSE